MLTSTIYLIRPFLLFSLLLLFTLFLSRLGLSLWQFDRFESIDTFIKVLFNGTRIDLSSIGYLLIIPALLHPWLLLATQLSKKWLIILKFIFVAIFISVLFFELATPAFINEYDLRPNRLFIEYLIYPKEVMSMLLQGHKLEMIFTFVGIMLGGWVGWKVICKFVDCNLQSQKISYLSTFPAFLFLIITLFVCARGTFSHRPINPSLVYFSTDSLVNSLTLNSAYSVAFAVKQLSNEVSASKVYGQLPEKDILRIIRQESELAKEAYVSEDIPTLAVRESFHKGKKKNLVIILEESLGAQFVGELDGLALTPEIDNLIKENWSFDRLYATGTRSVRGIEAVITGFTPTPARAVVKLDKSQSNFFTIASVLEKHNYVTQFVYGGESHFDNMKSFFLGNGFNSIIDFDDIESPEYVASWGASDEDLFNQANTELKKLNKAEKPFFSLIFSSSNHDPFDIPDGKVEAINYTKEEREQYGARELLRHKAIQYADYALGKFINQAKKEEYWENTVFLVVADHDARVYGSDLVPIKNFQVPAIILNSKFSNSRDGRVVSQIDLPPTLLSLIGIESPTPLIGFDLTKTYKKERAMMQFSNNFAYLENDNVAILQPHKPISYYRYDPKAKRLSDAKEQGELGEKSLAYALFGSLAYSKELYKLPK